VTEKLGAGLPVEESGTGVCMLTAEILELDPASVSVNL
jgi:hypothetical protein